MMKHFFNFTFGESTEVEKSEILGRFRNTGKRETSVWRILMVQTAVKGEDGGNSAYPSVTEKGSVGSPRIDTPHVHCQPFICRKALVFQVAPES